MIDQAHFLKTDYWRSRMYSEISRNIDPLTAGEGVEFGGSNGVLQSMLPAVHFETREYPDFDVCAEMSWERSWDVVLIDQVLEHVKYPWAAMKHLSAHTTKLAIVTVPFLALVHDWCPDDYWRFSVSGLQLLAGPNWSEIRTGSWGNQRAVRWLAEYGFDMPSLLAAVSEQELLDALDEDVRQLPVMVWAILRK